MRPHSYEVEVRMALRQARKTHPVTMGLFEVLVMLSEDLDCAELAGYSQGGRCKLVNEAIDSIADIHTDAVRSASEGTHPETSDLTPDEAQAILERVGLMPIPQTCQRRIGPVSRCSMAVVPGTLLCHHCAS